MNEEIYVCRVGRMVMRWPRDRQESQCP